MTAMQASRPFRGRRRGLRDAGALLDATAVPADRAHCRGLAAVRPCTGHVPDCVSASTRVTAAWTPGS